MIQRSKTEADEIEEKIINTYRVLARFNSGKRPHKKNQDGEGKAVTSEVSNLWPLPTQIEVRCDPPKFSGRNNTTTCKYVKHKKRKTFLH